MRPDRGHGRVVLDLAQAHDVVAGLERADSRSHSGSGRTLFGPEVKTVTT